MELSPHAILVDLALILGVAAILVLILGKLRQPAILGYLIAGALVGPAGLKLVRHGFIGSHWTQEDVVKVEKSLKHLSLVAA